MTFQETPAFFLGHSVFANIASIGCDMESTLNTPNHVVRKTLRDGRLHVGSVWYHHIPVQCVVLPFRLCPCSTTRSPCREYNEWFPGRDVRWYHRAPHNTDTDLSCGPQGAGGEHNYGHKPCDTLVRYRVMCGYHLVA